MKEKICKIIIAKDGSPLEEIINRPIVNFFRRLLLGDHKECAICYWDKKSVKNKTLNTTKSIQTLEKGGRGV